MQNLSYAIVYLDSTRRIHLFNDGAMSRMEYISDHTGRGDNPGWCLKEDDAKPWDDERAALLELGQLIAQRTAIVEVAPQIIVTSTIGDETGLVEWLNSVPNNVTMVPPSPEMVDEFLKSDMESNPCSAVKQ